MATVFRPGRHPAVRAAAAVSAPAVRSVGPGLPVRLPVPGAQAEED